MIPGPMVLLPARWLLMRRQEIRFNDFGATVLRDVPGFTGPVILIGEAFHLGSGHPSAAITPRDAITLADFLNRQALQLLEEEAAR